MAVTTTILKKVRQQAVVKMVAAGGGLANISLYDLALADETLDFANVAPSVNITNVYFATDTKVDITRNNAVVLSLIGQDNWSFSQETGFVISDHNSSNVQVNFGSSTGTLILTLNKTAGYTEPNEQIYQPRER